MNKIINFFKSGFNTDCGYSVHSRTYTYNGKPQLGYVLVKNYIMFWLPGYDRIEVFVDKADLDEYLTTHSITLNNTTQC